MIVLLVPSLASTKFTLVIKPQYGSIGAFGEGFAAVEKNGKWGFIDKKGKVVISFQFDDAHWDGFSEGLAAVKVGDKWGFINKTGKFEIKPQFLEVGLPFKGGFAGVHENEWSWSTIDRTGKILEGVNVWDSTYHDGRMLFYKDSKFGFKDEENNIVVEPVYDIVYDYSEGLAAVKQGELWGFIDKDGKEIIPFQYVNVHSFEDGIAVVQKESSWEWVALDKSGKELSILGDSYDKLSNFINGTAICSIDNKYGVIDFSGKILITPVYAYVRRLETVLPENIKGYTEKDLESVFEVWDGKNNYGLVNKSGKEILKPEDGVTFKYLPNRFILLEKENKGENVPKTYGLIDITGKRILNTIYTGIGTQVSDNLIAVQKGATCDGYDMNNNMLLKGGKWGYFDINGKNAIAFSYDGASDFFSGVATVYNKQGVKLINKAGKVIASKPQYIEALGFNKGIAAVKDKKGKWGFIDKSGKEIIKPQFVNEGFFDSNGNLRVGVGVDYLKCKYGVIDLKGKFILKPEYDYIFDFEDYQIDGYAQIIKNNKYGLMDKNYNVVLNPTYDKIGYSISDGMLWVKLNGKYGYLSCNKK